MAQQKATKKKAKAKQESKQRTLACNEPRRICIDGGKKTAGDLMLQLKSQTAAYLSVSGPNECGSKCQGTFRPQEKALDWDARVAKYATHPSVCHIPDIINYDQLV